MGFDASRMGFRGRKSELQGPGWDLGATIQCFKGQDAPRMGFDAFRMGFRGQNSVLWGPGCIQDGI